MRSQSELEADIKKIDKQLVIYLAERDKVKWYRWLKKRQYDYTIWGLIGQRNFLASLLNSIYGGTPEENKKYLSNFYSLN